MSSPPIGHNRPPADVEVSPEAEGLTAWVFETRGDLPRELPKMHYFQCDTHALYTALLKMPLEQRGFYMTAILAMYDRMEPLPADDREGMIATGVSDIRIYRRLKSALLGAERCLVEKPSGRISNQRFEDEVKKYVEKWKNRSAGRKKIGAVPDQTEMELPEQSEDAPLANPVANPVAKPLANHVANPELGKEVAEKSNENKVYVASNEPQLNVNHPDKLRDRVIIEEESRRGRDPQLPSHPELPLSETDVSDGARREAISGTDGAKPKAPYSDAFQAFWKAYPETKGMSKIDAWKAWKKLSTAEQVQAMAAVPEFRRQFEDRKRRQPDATCLHAQGFLNQKRFETLVEVNAGGQAKPSAWWLSPEKVSQVTPERWRKAISEHANGIWPVDVLGPPPGSHRCVVPREIVAELKLTDTYTPAGIRRQ